MASYQFLNQTDKVSDSSLSNECRHGRSKAQMCLHKIIDLIVSLQSSVGHYETPKQSSLDPQFDYSELQVNSNRDQTRALFCGNRGFPIDLNIRLCPLPETEESESATSRFVGPGEDKACVVRNSISPAVSVDDSLVHEKSSEGECDAKEIEELYGSDLPATEANENEEEATEISEITNPELRSSEIDNNGVSDETKGEEYGKIKTQEEDHEDTEYDEIDKEFVTEKEQEHRNEGCLELLLEAAKLISGECGETEPGSEKPSHKSSNTETNRDTKGSKRSHCWMVDELSGEFRDVSPVVRSKRGRNQVLPYRYRDSVVEPLNRLCRQKSSKRRSR